MVEQRPTVGRIVHYVAYGTPGGEFPAGICRAAIVTEVYQLLVPTRHMSDNIALVVLNPTGMFFQLHCPYSEEKKPGSWHWPERTP